MNALDMIARCGRYQQGACEYVPGNNRGTEPIQTPVVAEPSDTGMAGAVALGDHPSDTIGTSREWGTVDGGDMGYF